MNYLINLDLPRKINYVPLNLTFYSNYCFGWIFFGCKNRHIPVIFTLNFQKVGAHSGFIYRIPACPICNAPVTETQIPIPSRTLRILWTAAKNAIKPCWGLDWTPVEIIIPLGKLPLHLTASSVKPVSIELITILGWGIADGKKEEKNNNTAGGHREKGGRDINTSV